MVDFTVTPAQHARTVRDWSALAGEAVTVEATRSDEPIYAFGSELACLRLVYAMRVGRVAYSANLGTWFYCNRGEG